MFSQSDLTVWGLDVGLRTMRKGEFSRFLLQPRYAFGEMGCPPLIPPSATVLYEVQIFDYLDSAQVDEFFALLPVSFVLFLKNIPNQSQNKVCLDLLDKLLKVLKGAASDF